MNDAFQSHSLIFDDVSAYKGEHMLFSGISFEITSGDLIWLQGANGIGKTSLLRLAAGFAKPDAGKISWTKDLRPCRVDRLVAYQGHSNALKRQISVIEELTFWSKVYAFEGAISELLSRVGLTDKAHIKAGGLSAGQGRRLAIARLLMSNKPIWIMDEPAAAMDADGQSLILDVIDAHISNGGAALVASHDNAQPFTAQTRRLTLEATC